MSQVEMIETEKGLEVMEPLTHYNEKTEMTVREVREMAFSGKITIRTEQRPFRKNREQFLGIVDSIIKGLMYAPIVLCDINSSLERSIRDNNEVDTNFFKKILGILYILLTCEDGQHRISYFISDIFDELPEETKNKLLDSKIPVVIQKYYTLEDITTAFNYTNSGNKIKNQDLVWSNVTSFNTELRDLPSNLGLVRYSNRKGLPLAIRDTYKFTLKSLKVLAHIEGVHSVNSGTGDKGLIKFVRQNFTLDNFSGILNCMRTMMVVLEDGILNNPKEDYTKYNLLFSIHSLRVKDIEASLEDIVGHVNNFPTDDTFGSRNSSVLKRYKAVNERILGIYEQQS
jgi:hypothetical protein